MDIKDFRQLKHSGASFRDPSGNIYINRDGQVFRTVTQHGKAAYEYVKQRGIVELLEKDNFLIKSEEVLTDENPYFYKLLEHPRLPFISYPYEWSFEQLRSAALLHLSLHLKCLEKNVTLSDSSAYNVQFNGHNPVFIDRLSLVPYQEGDAWYGQKQFTEQFIAPLLLTAHADFPHQELYRGYIHGIPMSAVQKILPWTKKLSLKYFSFITLPQSFELKPSNRSSVKKVHLPKDGLIFILKQLEKWIAGLPSPSTKTFWTDYESFRIYTDEEVSRKKEFISEAVQNIRPSIVWDIGCNRGEFSELALRAGAQSAIGFETDRGALEGAYKLSQDKKLPFLPLYMDICNPSPSLGWAQQERQGLKARANASMVLSLAVLHHIVIGNNVPLDKALKYIISLAPTGILEWIPKEDPMIQKMLSTRKDIFDSYNHDFFLQTFIENAEILREIQVSASGRRLYFYKRPS